MIAFADKSITFCGGYEGCYHNTSTHPTGLALQEMERFINNLKIKKGETSYMTGIKAAYKVLGSQKHIEGTDSHEHGKSVNNNTVL